MHWWLKKGSDGFRMDVVSGNHLAMRLPAYPTDQLHFQSRWLPGCTRYTAGSTFPAVWSIINQPTSSAGSSEGNVPRSHPALRSLLVRTRRAPGPKAHSSVGECPGDEDVDKYSVYSRQSDPEQKMLQMVFHFHQSVPRGISGLY